MMLLLALALAADDPATEQAREVYRQAETHYKLGRFEEALSGFNKTYELKPTPGLLFNIGQCHFQLKNWERAIFFYEGFLRDANPKPAVRAQVNLQLADCRRELAKEQRAKRDAPKPTPVVAAPQPASAEAPRTIVVAPAPQPPAPAAVVIDEPTPVYKKWWLWTIVGVVVAGAAAGTATYLILSQPKPEPIRWQ